jgi:hypothetical protein
MTQQLFNFLLSTFTLLLGIKFVFISYTKSDVFLVQL